MIYLIFPRISHQSKLTELHYDFHCEIIWKKKIGERLV